LQIDVTPIVRMVKQALGRKTSNAAFQRMSSGAAYLEVERILDASTAQIAAKSRGRSAAGARGVDGHQKREGRVGRWADAAEFAEGARVAMTYARKTRWTSASQV
jgi:hypothetical protein